jgi:hypothetical protein
MEDGPTEDGGKDKGKGLNLVVFPGGKKVDPSKVGADYVVRQTGDVPTPELVDPSEVNEEVRARKRYVDSQELVRSACDGSSTGRMMDLLVHEITEELAHLKYERRKAAKEGKNTANYSVGRMNSLKGLADLLLKRREADRDEELDLRSPRFQAVFKVWMEFFSEAMDKVGVEPKIIDLVFQQMKADMIDWEKKMTDAQ